MKANVAIAILALVGLLGHLMAYRDRAPTAICGTDFPVFYSAAKLVGSPNLYSPEALQRLEEQEIGCTTPWAAYIRLPYFAALLHPLTSLPVSTAFAVWRATALAAVVGFIALFRAQWKWALLACIWSNAVAWDLDNGQDVAFLLFIIAAAIALIQGKRGFAAGFCLSLCANKYHLFVLLPLLLVRKDMRKTAWGTLGGGAILLAISFIAGGWNWPVEYLHAITSARIDPVPSLLTNLRGFAGGSWPLEIFLDLTVVGAVWCICRQASFQLSLAAVIAGGLLMSHHFTASDWALLIPAALLVARECSPFASALALLLITPLVTRLSQPQLIAGTLLVLVYALAYEALRRPVPVERQDAALGTTLAH